MNCRIRKGSYHRLVLGCGGKAGGQGMKGQGMKIIDKRKRRVWGGAGIREMRWGFLRGG